ncbi:MAG: hypothetical protein JWN85_1104 [Gammaproteobacteria bacterium]|nr:hypothetical protein [Gammaproteobacteria bacterium]
MLTSCAACLRKLPYRVEQMHLAQRAYILLLLTAVLAIGGIWSSEPGFGGLWRLPAALLFSGLAFEGFIVAKITIAAGVETAARAFLGREQPAAFVFRNDYSRAVSVEYAPVVPGGFEPLGDVRRVIAPAHGVGRDSFKLLPIRLGIQSWPTLPSRVLGPLGLAWWSKGLHPAGRISVAPDTLRTPGSQPRGNPAGARPRRIVGAGAELHQLRGYLPGDPLARIDWKATARMRRLVTREFSEDQHLDILVAIDAGRFSRVRAGRLDRFGLYANVAARFAEIATPNDDRIGLMVFSDRPLVACAPARGLTAVTRMRRALEQLSVESAESDPTAAAVRIRGMLRHRSLVVLLTDLDDATGANSLARAVRLLSPPHLVVIAGIRSPEIEKFASGEAHEWSDPWVALAAQEHEARAALQRSLLRRLGARVIVASEELLERAVLAEYETLRRSRRV